jgi:hypothetical protein
MTPGSDLLALMEQVGAKNRLFGSWLISCNTDKTDNASEIQGDHLKF